MSIELYAGGREVIATGSVIVRPDRPLQLVLFKGEPRELTCIFNFEIVDQDKKNAGVRSEPLNANGAMFEVDVVEGSYGLTVIDEALAESEDFEIYASFKIHSNSKEVIEFGYTFTIEEKAPPKKDKKRDDKKK